jgi:Intracellular proteinase inhibitor
MRSVSTLQKGRRILLVLGTMAICLGATSQSCSLRDILKKNSNSNLSFSTTLRLLDNTGSDTNVFNQGDPITLQLEVHNLDNNSATIDFTTSDQTDFVVVKADTKDVVWQWSKHQPAPSDTASTLEFAANQTRTFRVNWDQTDDSGNLLDRGDYQARGVVIFDGFSSNPLKDDQLGSTLARFKVQ